MASIGTPSGPSLLALAGLTPLDGLETAAGTDSGDADGPSLFWAKDDLFGANSPAELAEPALPETASGLSSFAPDTREGDLIWIDDPIIDEGIIIAPEEDYSSFWSDAAGDVNGDGIEDFIVNTYSSTGGVYASETYVRFGTADGAAPSGDIAEIGNGGGFRLVGEDGTNANFWAMAAGDLNGDGAADLLVSSYDDSGGQSFRIVFGAATGLNGDVDVSGGTALSLTGVGSGEDWWASAAGDINGDGIADLQIDVFGETADGEYTNSSYIVFGKAGGFGGSIDVANLDPGEGYLIPEILEEPDTGDGVIAYDPAVCELPAWLEASDGSTGDFIL